MNSTLLFDLATILIASDLPASLNIMYMVVLWEAKSIYSTTNNYILLSSPIQIKAQKPLQFPRPHRPSGSSCNVAHGEALLSRIELKNI